MTVPTRYIVNEIYRCLQGEGANLGRPSILVRFQVCNLRCSWCDTPYTHTLRSDPLGPDSGAESEGAKRAEDAEGMARAGNETVNTQRFKRQSVAELASAIRAAGPETHLILTGGEPTLQNFFPLLEELGPEYSAEVETNGTRIPHRDLQGFPESAYARVQWNVSPKGRNAGCELHVDALAHWAELARKGHDVWFKFVVRAEPAEAAADLAEIDEMLARFDLPRARAFLMPEGTSRESQIGRADLHDACLARGLRYTPRLHVLLFGSERGK